MSRFSTLKDPGSTLDYQIDWSQWLASSNTTTETVQWLAGGTVGAVYQVVNQITTAGGRIAERTIEIRMIDR